MEKIDIINFIPCGKPNAIHLRELVEASNKKPTIIKKEIKEARQKGIFVLSGSCGYWISNDKEEQREFIATMRKQALSRLKSIKPINDSFKQCTGQLKFSDYEKRGSRTMKECAETLFNVTGITAEELMEIAKGNENKGQ